MGLSQHLYALKNHRFNPNGFQCMRDYFSDILETDSDYMIINRKQLEKFLHLIQNHYYYFVQEYRKYISDFDRNDRGFLICEIKDLLSDENAEEFLLVNT